jgi:hypothetical protein
MAEGWGSTIGNAALDMLDSYRWIQLHIGSPGGSGTGNIALTTTRIQTTWLASAGGVKASSVDTVWTSSQILDTAGTAFLCWSAWTLASGGVFGGSGTISALAVSSGRGLTLPAGLLVASMALAS